MRLAVIVPIYNEEASLPELVEQLRLLKEQGAAVIVVDGSSTDNCAPKLRQQGLTVINAPKMRSRQMNVGAWWAKKTVQAEVLVFLHADSRLPPDALDIILKSLKPSERQSADAANQPIWGRFDVRLTNPAFMFRLISYLINLRSRLSGIATGDQAIFVRADTFFAMGGYQPIALMEDVEISKRLRARSTPICLRAKVTTSARRWERHGVWRTIVLMWKLRFLYWVGVSPDKLASRYR